MGRKLWLNFIADDARTLLEPVLALGLHPDTTPKYVELQSRDQRKRTAWRELIDAHWVDRSRNFDITWKSDDRTTYLFGNNALSLMITPHYDFDPQFLFDVVREVPFEFFTNGAFHQEWRSDRERIPYGRGPYPYWPGQHGFMTAIRGKGHDTLVSRRWLDHGGPWLLIRDEPTDTSIFVFHEWDANAYAAHSQAYPGWWYLSATTTGGTLCDLHDPSDYGVTGTYRPDLRRMDIVVHGRKVEPREMTAMCRYRREHRDDPDMPIDNVRYVFMDEAEAHAHLFQLWRRELECSAYNPHGEEIRLDADYTPPPTQHPKWVHRMAASLGVPVRGGGPPPGMPWWREDQPIPPLDPVGTPPIIP